MTNANDFLIYIQGFGFYHSEDSDGKIYITSNIKDAKTFTQSSAEYFSETAKNQYKHRSKAREWDNRSFINTKVFILKLIKEI